ncbi:MAG TPA: hypothetical protein VH640_03470 [Bryobacteraceae bacterium]|jgi:hypothetical protein
MNFNFTPFAIFWLVLAVTILGLAAYRALVSEHEEDALHLSNPREMAHQLTITHRLDLIDRWGKLLTIAAAVYSLLLAAGYAYYVWTTWNVKPY